MEKELLAFLTEWLRGPGYGLCPCDRCGTVFGPDMKTAARFLEAFLDQQKAGVGSYGWYIERLLDAKERIRALEAALRTANERFATCERELYLKIAAGEDLIAKLEAELTASRALSNERYMEACNQAQLAEDLRYQISRLTTEAPSAAEAEELARQVEVRAHELMLANNPELRRQLHEHEAQARRDMESRMWKAAERALYQDEEK